MEVASPTNNGRWRHGFTIWMNVLFKPSTQINPGEEENQPDNNHGDDSEFDTITNNHMKQHLTFNCSVSSRWGHYQRSFRIDLIHTTLIYNLSF